MLVQDVIARRMVAGANSPGETAVVQVDRIYLQDGNSPTIARLFKEHGFGKVFDPKRVGVFFDHSVIWPNAEIAGRIREAMAFCEEIGVRVFPPGDGISHVVAMEEGWFEPGSIVLGTDSHTCTGGANQALALGMGASDVVAAMITGETWLRVPETVRLEIVGTPSQMARPKDVMLHVLATFGQDPFLYKSVEWCGEWAESLSDDGAATVANMAVEMGAKCAFLPPHGSRRDHLRPIPSVPAAGGSYLRLDVSGLPPFVARPHAPGNAHPIDACAGEPVNYVFIGSCTNSRLEDIAEAARVMDGRTVHPNVHMLVTPGSKSILLEAMALGYIETLTRAGAIVTPPGCGSCLGTQGSVPARGDRVLTTMNRNFLGRMGNAEADIFLASPIVAAHAALSGLIPFHSDLS